MSAVHQTEQLPRQLVTGTPGPSQRVDSRCFLGPTASPSVADGCGKLLLRRNSRILECDPFRKKFGNVIWKISNIKKSEDQNWQGTRFYIYIIPLIQC